MPCIHRLDAALVNKIAAGEVIERPASVVKELLENAVDAGARRLTVEIEDGGAALIRVTDDGLGMEPDDLPLAVAPHATSKIASTDDLFHISTLGFRGEALASVAAVSRLRILSRRHDQPAGHELTACDGRIDGPRPASAAPGTTVEVRDLFFNVPARRKFLRASQTEAAHVTEQIARVTLSHPEVALRQLHQGREVRNLPATADRRGRIADFYGSELAAELIAVDRRERDLRIEALAAPPASARASTRWQYVFLNGRYIADRAIGFAIREAFRGLVEPSRHPIVFLFLTTDPDRYDVNVHPTKIEVRWRDAGLVQSQVLAVLRETLLGRDLTPAYRTEPRRVPDPAHAESVRAAIADFLRHAPPTQPRFDLPARDTHPATPTEMRDRPPAAVPPRPAGRLPTDPAGPPLEASPGIQDAPSPCRALQVHNTYLVIESEDGVMIVDQHALHERLLYEQIRERILAGSLESQRLLLPETLDAAPRHRLAVAQHAELLVRLGIEIAPFGPSSLAVHAFPSFLHHVDVRAFVRDLLDRLAEPGHAENNETLLHELLDMMACKAAVKAGDPLSQEEIETLMARRDLIDRSSNCPHGRPTTLRLSLRDLERQFKRT